MTTLKHKFVECIPDVLDEGVLYVSVAHGTVIHRCCCGCGREVVTPLARSDWKLIFDGETVSLSPSIGNWNFPCRSHYWIRHNRVEWADDWTQNWQAATAKEKARKIKKKSNRDQKGDVSVERSEEQGPARSGFWARLWKSW